MGVIRVYGQTTISYSGGAVCPGDVIAVTCNPNGYKNNVTGVTINGTTATFTVGTGGDINVTVPASGLSRSTSGVTANNLIATDGTLVPNCNVNVQPGPASLTYPAGPFCKGSVATITPTAFTPTPSASGAFTKATGGPTFSMNSTTGVITTSGTNAGTYTVTYTSPYCPSEAATSTNIVINNSPNVTPFFYTPSTVCANGANPTPSFPGTGNFTISPALTGFPNTTGVFNTSAATPGTTYTITYTRTVSGCTSTATATVAVVALPTATPFSYPSPSVCKNSGNHTPSFPGSGNFTISPALAGFPNTTGVFDANAATAGQTYTVTYSRTVAGCTSTATTTITVNALPTLALTYPGITSNTICPPASNSGTNHTWYKPTVTVNSSPHPATVLSGTEQHFPDIVFSYVQNSGPGANDINLDNSSPFTEAATDMQSPGVEGSVAGRRLENGQWTITALYTDVNGCTDSDTYTLNVTSVSDPGFAFIPAGICAVVCTVGTCSTSVFPNTVAQSGGTWSIDTTVSNTIFNTSNAAIRSDLLPVGNYKVFHTHTASGCTMTDSQSVQIVGAGTPNLSYPNPVCRDQDTIFPKVDGFLATPLGFDGSFTFSANSPDSPTANLFSASNKNEGALLPSAMALSEDTIYVTFSPLSTCLSPTKDTIYIGGASSGGFSYGVDSVCYTAGPLTPTPVNMGGTYTSLGGQFTVNSFSGETSFGTFTQGVVDSVQYTFTNAFGCVTSTVEILKVKPKDNASFAYAPDSLCLDAPNEIPTVAFPTGSFSLVSTNSLSFVSTSTGEIDVSNSSSGKHIIKYTTAGFCPNSSRDTITLVQIDPAAFSYPGGVNPSWCVNENPKYPIFTGLGGGAFNQTAGPASGLLTALDTATGKIIPWLASPGSYTITYSTAISPLSHCPNTTTAQFQVVGQTPASVSYSQPTYCKSGSTGPPVVSNSGYFSEPTQSVKFLSTLTGNINLNTTPAGGPYLIVYITDTGGCPDTATAIVQIYNNDAATINYPSNSKYCENDPYPTPIIVGTTGGVFTSSDPVNFPVNSVTGEITLNLNPLSNVANFNVTYATSGPCATSTMSSIQVLPQENANFTYLTSYCESDTLALPTTIADTTSAGAFFGCDSLNSISPCSNLVITPSTGQITPYLSVPGEYTIQRYVPSNGIGCDATHDEDIVIVDENTVRMYFLKHEYCKGSPNDKPIIIGDDSTGYFDFTYLDSAATGNEIISFLSSYAGLISFVGSSPGLFEILYSVPGQCKNEDRDTIQIYPNENADFFYDTTSYCEGEPNPSPLIISDTIGSFVELTGNVVFLDDTLGTIDLVNSFPGGPYFITYNTYGRCPKPVTKQLRINRQPDPLMKANPGIEICQGTPISFKVEGSQTGPSIKFTFFLNDSLILTSNSNRFDPLVDMTPPYTLQDGDEIKGLAKFVPQLGGCEASDSVTMTVNPIPTVVLLNPTTTVTGDDPVSLQLFSTADSTVFYWDMYAQGRVIPEEVHDSSDFVMTGDWTYLNPSLVLLDDITPAQLAFAIQPVAKGCVGTVDSVFINVNPNDQPIFIPGVITPNGDGRNDYWNIQFEQGLTPEDFWVQLYNRSGGLVDEFGLTFPMTWTGENLPDGVYWYILTEVATGDVWAKGGLAIRKKHKSATN
ncbi:MAG: gliding motility-associated C-terminal domain-containing protein [Bacteroidia bacterium]|nr:gliding motility-associated C-terminal domain-containing protein [Bacteroidia bacterium]